MIGQTFPSQRKKWIQFENEAALTRSSFDDKKCLYSLFVCTPVVPDEIKDDFYFSSFNFMAMALKLSQSNMVAFVSHLTYTWFLRQNFRL